MSSSTNLVTPKIDEISLLLIPWEACKLDVLIGNGGFGDVYKGRWLGIDVMIKQLYLKTFKQQLKVESENETHIMERCQFPHVVRLHGVCREPGRYGMVMNICRKVPYTTGATSDLYRSRCL